MTAALPTEPTSTVNITYSLPTGNTHNPNTTAELTTLFGGGILDGSTLALGDVIKLDAGTVYADAPFTLPNLGAGTDWVYVISGSLSSLPADGYRVASSDSVNMPKIRGTTAAGAALVTENLSHHFRFVGIEFIQGTSGNLTNIVEIGNAQSSFSITPHHIIFDRCYVHGEVAQQARRGIRFDPCNDFAVINCYFSEIKTVNADSQAVLVIGTQGPVLIQNNYLQAASECLMIGGDDQSVSGNVPNDITIKYNHFDKNTDWQGSTWQVKNLLEFKIGQRMLVEGNLFTNIWAEDQIGAITNCGPAVEETAPWTQCHDITWRYNFGYNCEVGLQLGGQDPPATSNVPFRYLSEHNVFLLGEPTAGGERMYQSTGDDGITNLTIRHNTWLLPGGVGDTMFFEHLSPAESDEFDVHDNILSRGSTGVDGTGSNEGTNAFDEHFLTYSVTSNAFIGATAASYPSGNYFPVAISTIAFVNYQGDGTGDYSLVSSSPFAAGNVSTASDGTDMGAHWNVFKNQITAAQAGTPVSQGSGSILGERIVSFGGYRVAVRFT